MRAHEYITREPYRTLASRQLARVLFYVAVSEKDSSFRISINKLRKAREVSPDFVTITAFAIGFLLIVTGVGPFVYGRWSKPVRQLAAKLAGMKKHV